jgi:hypothetical protein
MLTISILGQMEGFELGLAFKLGGLHSLTSACLAVIYSS